ncbi:hypothetical protein H257_08885 [Aphanomyces astaci]|uniref:Uncharacterized protein n=1 Tax=Aphanomyces astaci TaxID=112090 RepID=W4GCS3_APHAT|nr:hypothetical protein H257_08885 [Aphanomyces astaci]ETV77475.1 hypothetical protein H257_08885 [Aphanomyces astaci]|eukprot:XP_009833262.1 hypothetical protein H257_08885 [Aphanomyces astaci]
MTSLFARVFQCKPDTAMNPTNKCYISEGLPQGAMKAGCWTITQALLGQPIVAARPVRNSHIRLEPSDAHIPVDPPTDKFAWPFQSSFLWPTTWPLIRKGAVIFATSGCSVGPSATPGPEGGQYAGRIVWGLPESHVMLRGHLLTGLPSTRGNPVQTNGTNAARGLGKPDTSVEYTGSPADS